MNYIYNGALANKGVGKFGNLISLIDVKWPRIPSMIIGGIIGYCFYKSKKNDDDDEKDFYVPRKFELNNGEKLVLTNNDIKPGAYVVNQTNLKTYVYKNAKKFGNHAENCVIIDNRSHLYVECGNIIELIPNNNGHAEIEFYMVR